MIKHFQENDFVELFLDCPIYIGEAQGGELIFKREYDNGLVFVNKKVLQKGVKKVSTFNTQ